MSSNRVVLLEGNLYLAIDTGRLVVRRRDGQESLFSPDDIAVLIVDHPDITITAAAIKKLIGAGSIVLVTDDKHLPAGVLVSNSAPTRSGRRLRQQLKLEQSEQASLLWRDIVAARVLTQAQVLRVLGRNGALYLERLAQKVRPDDASNHEAQAARHYWKHLWPNGFRRTKQGAQDGINARLNYGYAIARSFVARAACAAGLHTMIGIGHASEENPFNLVDDLLEVYRFVVELHVAELLANDAGAPFDASARKSVAECAAREVRMSAGVFRFAAAVEATVESFVRFLDIGGPASGQLAVPEGLA